MTAEDHLREGVGRFVAALLFENAMLKAEIDRLRDARPAPPPTTGYAQEQAPP
jgi:hypothetical protein